MNSNIHILTLLARSDVTSVDQYASRYESCFAVQGNRVEMLTTLKVYLGFDWVITILCSV